ncbi:MAG: DUF2680 domain-containing protein [Syntrophomonas sp.]|nr:DUF2680 domain-containing protein [Syntrophomonas sp.]
MKRVKKFVMAFTVMAVLGTASVAYAVSATTPAQITAGLTGKSVETLNQERATGKTYGAIASEAGKLEEFKAQMLEQKKVILDQRVEGGKITQEQADTIYTAIQNNQTNCDGTGSAKIGQKAGIRFGNGPGEKGQGVGMKQGQGNRSRTGICDGTGIGAGQGLTR